MGVRPREAPQASAPVPAADAGPKEWLRQEADLGHRTEDSEKPHESARLESSPLHAIMGWDAGASGKLERFTELPCF